MSAALPSSIFDVPGVAATVLRGIDWARSPVGPVAGWPFALQNLLKTMLASRQAMALYWGPRLVQFYNDAAIPIFGSKHPSAMGMAAVESWLEAWDVIAPPLMRVIQHGEPFLARDQLIPILRGGAIEDAWWTYSYSPVHGDDGAVAGSLTIVSETTDAVLGRRELERRAAENALARQKVEDDLRAREDFLATVSHELRTPLMAILGWTELLADVDQSPRLSKGLAIIERNARAQAKLIDDILDSSRVVAGKLSLERAPLDLVSLVTAAVEGFRPAADAKSLQLTLSLEVQALPLGGDEGRLQQVVANLLTNALKFTPAGGIVDVRLWRSGDAAHLRVRDTGRGIAAEFVPHLFQPFRQSDSSTTRREGGLGLGLSIAHHLVELHGGVLTATSEGEGKGASFEVRLPIIGSAGHSRGVRDAPMLGAASPDQKAVPAPALRGAHVLVVEDEPDSRELIVSILEQAGARATSVSSAAAALARFSELDVSLIVSDVGLPDVDGYAFISAVRALIPRTPNAQPIPAIAVTSYAQPHNRVRALEAGFDDYLSKPFQPSALVAAVAALIARGPIVSLPVGHDNPRRPARDRQ